MSFVSKIIELSEAVNMSKPYYKYNIKEIDELLSEYLYKEAFFEKKKIETKEYMNYVGLLKNTLYYIKLNSKLIYRIIAKGKEKDEK